MLTSLSTDDRHTVQSVSRAAKQFTKKASGYRLNQQPASKTAAHSALTAAEVKEKTADLKELRTNEHVAMEVTGYYNRSVLGTKPIPVSGNTIT